MKIAGSIRSHYEGKSPLYTGLQEKVDRIFKTQLRGQWHYQSRIKEIASYAQKIETGRLNPADPEDLFACLIVVENSSRIEEAVEIIKKYFTIQYSRPADRKVTSKSPDSFRFDDLRLYVKLTPNPSLPPDNFSNLLFEIQIKTFLQHAWSIATHDLVYKTDEVSWSRQRIAFQIKASLEGAETTISNFPQLEGSANIDMEDNDTQELKTILSLIKFLWPDSDVLPKDLTRFAKTVQDLEKATGISTEEIEICLKEESSIGRGTKLTNLPVYSVIIQSLIYTDNLKFKKYITKPKSDKQFKILIVDELDIPASFPAMHESAIIRV
jgi:ppGpp synthetase/RelA/SpoT-type nucleotidyltranferase